MKKFACEMCDSGDLIKQGDFYVCQNCGTKYTPEDAKKLMIEGTVQIDRSIDISNLYTLARRARETNNIESARKYYEQLVQLDPNNWEAYFFSVYYQQLDCKIYQIASAARNIKNTIEPTVRMIESLSNSSEKADAYNVLAESVLSAAKTLHFSALNHYNNNSNANGAFNELDERERACADLIQLCASLLKSTDYGKKPAFKLYEYLQSNNYVTLNIDKEKIWQYMHECDPSFDANSKINEINTQELKQRQTLKRCLIYLAIVGIIVIVGFIFIINDL